MMLFRSFGGHSIVNISKCDYIILKYDYSASKYNVIAFFQNGEVCICLGAYKDSKSAKIAMNFIQNNNNYNYRKVCDHIEPEGHNSDGYIFDMITQEEADKVLEYFTDEDNE